MPSSKITGFVVSQVWDDDSVTKYEIKLNQDEYGSFVYISEEEDLIRIRKGAWELIKNKVDDLFRD